MTLIDSIKKVDDGLMVKVVDIDGIRLVYIDEQSSEYERYLTMMEGRE